MALIDNFEFFESNGKNLNPNYDSTLGVYNFELMFEKTSTSLFSTNQIHILERCINISDGQSKDFLTRPKTTSGEKLKVKFKNKNYENFFCYRIEFSNKQYYVETISNSKTIDLQTNSDSTQPYVSQQDQYTTNGTTLAKNEIFPTIKKIQEYFVYNLETTTEVSNPTQESESKVVDNIRHIVDFNDNVDGITLNIAVTSEIEGEFQEILELYLVNEFDEETLLATINLYAEIEEEDERFTNLLDTLGQELNQDDSLVFRETSVLEDFKNEVVLNKKRKELILEYGNIIPYTGSYKGLINALKFYGYGDLRLKEYWLNLETEKHFQEEISLDTFTPTNKKRQGYSPVLKKTGKFSLVYDITRADYNETDENGLPLVERVDMFSQEEILIKLFGLKTLLKNKFLPLGTRIVDITGESITFKYTSATFYSQQLETVKVNEFDYNFQVKATPSFAYLDKVYRDTPNIFPQEASLTASSDVALSEISNFPLESFEYLNTKGVYDSPNRNSYTTINLRNTTFDTIRDDMGYSFEDLEQNSRYTFENFYFGDFYEIEWEISKSDEKYAVYKNFKGPIADFNEINVDLEYDGYYDVSITLHDTYNNFIVRRFPKLIRVEQPKPNFGGLYLENKRFQTWNDLTPYNLTFEDPVSYDFMYNDCDFQDANITFESLDPRSYMNLNLLDGVERRPILDLDRNKMKVWISKFDTDTLKKVTAQKYLNFYKEYDSTKRISGVTVIDVDSTNNTIEIEGTDKKIDLYDLVQINIETTVVEPYFDITDDIISVSVPIRRDILDGCTVTLVEATTNVETTLAVKKVDINELTSTTTFELYETESKLYNKVFDTLKINSRFFSFEVTELLEEKEYSLVYKVDWGGLSIPRTSDFQLNNRVTPPSDTPPRPSGGARNDFGQVTIDLYDLSAQVGLQNLKDLNRVKSYLQAQKLLQLPNASVLSDNISDESVRTFLQENIFDRVVVQSRLALYNAMNQKGEDLYVSFDFETSEQLDHIGETIAETTSDERIVARWNLLNGKRSIKVDYVNTEKFTDRIEITLNDYNRELFQVTKNFMVELANYDVEYARRFCGTQAYNFDNLEQVDFEDVSHLRFDNIETHPSTLPAFKLMGFEAGARMKIGNGDTFTFSDSCSGNVDIAISELYSSDIKELKYFDYFKVNANVIQCVSKYPIQESLNIIEYSGGLYSDKMVSPRYGHNYPLPTVYSKESLFKPGTQNNRNYINRLIRDWVDFGETPFIEQSQSLPENYGGEDYNLTFQMNLGPTISGNFRSDNLHISDKGLKVKPFTLCYFYGDISPIWGKTRYKWTIRNQYSGENLIETYSERLTFCFAQKGFYDVILEVEDNKGNKSSIEKNGFVNVT